VRETEISKKRERRLEHEERNEEKENLAGLETR
jgi:hypothetical protein